MGLVAKYSRRTGNLFLAIAIRLFPVIFLVYSSAVLRAQDETEISLRNWKSCYNMSFNDSLRIIRLSELAYFYSDYNDERQKADSLYSLAVEIAECSGLPTLLLALNKSLEYADIDAKSIQTQAFAQRAQRLLGDCRDPFLRFETCRNLASFYLAGRKADSALIWSCRAFQMAQKGGNNSWKAASWLDIGKSLLSKSKTAAFQYYLRATEMAEKISDTALLKLCYTQLYLFYRDNKLYENAFNYLERKRNMIRGSSFASVLERKWVEYDSLTIVIDKDNRSLRDEAILNLFEFAVKNKALRLKNYSLALYRRHFLDSEEIDKLYNLYKVQYPQELRQMERKDPLLYYRLQGFFAEYRHRPDSAIFYFNKAEQRFRSLRSVNGYLFATFYYRYGQFYLRHNEIPKAIDKFLMSYQIASQVRYISYMLLSSKQISELYREMNDYRNAYAYLMVNKQLTHHTDSLLRNDEVIRIEILKMRQNWVRKNDEEKQRIEMRFRQQRTEKYFMTGGVGVLILLSFFIFRSYRIQKKYNRRLDAEKRRSDSLLHNILPHETAEELKTRGAAEARRYEEVTVMFTDFKDFTQTSEKMTAEELVKIINHYFSEFDKIITRYNIEKIKIIGDSYMCAGGLPVENETHALDVVSAALDLQEFVAEERELRKARGDTYFELRIGIHTGPVVAGIVGLRKFAYDIWGDTVNTASRMENTGEINKVNISGSTYEKIRTIYSCSYRGKVKAKHKGEIDMYFIEAPVSRGTV
jgi:class 3 adenylate cyclase